MSLLKSLKGHIQSLLLFLLISFVAACGGGGGGGSDSYDQNDDAPPVANADIIGVGSAISGSPTTYAARANSEVVLTGKDSFGGSLPVLDFVWVQTEGPTVTLIEKNSSSVAFDAPNVKIRTTLTFQLTVTDGNSRTAVDEVAIDIIPVDDAGRFLVDPSLPDSELNLLAALRENENTGSSEQLFTIEAITIVRYTNSTGDADSLIVNTQTLNGSFPANFSAPASYDPATEPRNPILTIDLVNLDADDINQNYETANRDRRLEPYNLGTAYLEIQINLTQAPSVDFEVFALNSSGDAIDGDDIAALITGGSSTSTSSSKTVNRSTLRSSSISRATSSLPSNGALLQTWTGFTSAEIFTNNIRKELGLPNNITANNYYALIDPTGQFSTLNNWLKYAGFLDNDGNTINEESTAHALYVNNYDLGFGRDMFLRKDDNGNVYSYVVNYPTLELAIEGRAEFATVVMEYSDNPDPAGANDKIVKFYAYVPDERTGEFIRATSLNFDGDGEKFLPGVCTICHQSNPGASDFTDVADADLNATFIPWDLDSLLYTKAEDQSLVEPTLNPEFIDPALIDRYSLENQEEDFRKLNEGALATYAARPDRYEASIQLIHGWYGDGALELPVDQLPNNNFDGTYIQPGWVGNEEIYEKVFSRTCRICHTQLDSPTNNFDVAAELLEDPRLIEYIYEKGLMPAAKVSLDRFWVSYNNEATSAEILKQYLQNQGETVQEAPGLPIPDFNFNLTNPVLGDTIVVDASPSAFSDNFTWSLTNPSGSTVTLNNTSGLTSSFDPDLPGGIYRVTLTTSNEEGEEESASKDITVIDRTPIAECLTADASGLTDAGLLANIPVISELAPSSAGDGGISLNAVLDGTLGTLAIDSGNATVSYQLNNPFNRGVDLVSYQITDFNGSLSVTDINCATTPTSGYGHISIDSTLAGTLVPSNVTATTDATNNTYEVDITWDAPTGVTPDSYKLFRDGSEIADQTARTYTDTPLNDDTTYSYTVRTVIGAFESNDSAADTATTLSLVPQNLTGNSISETQIDLDWDAPAGNVSTYSVYRDSGSGFVAIITGLGVDNYSDTSVSAGNSYDYYVTSVDSSPQESSASNTVSNASKPNPPASLTATTVSSTNIDLTWPAVTDATSYQVFRKLSSDGAYPGSPLATPGTNSYSDTSGSPGTTYDYRVGSTVNGEDSITYASDSATTIPTTPAVSSATGFNGNTSTIRFEWLAVADPNVTGYDVFVDDNGSGSAVVTNISGTSCGGNCLYYDATGFSAGESHTFRVKSVAGGNRSIVSGQRTGYTAPATPGQPNGTVVDADTITVSGYGITCSGDTPSYTIDATPGGNTATSSTSQAVDGLTGNTAYTFSVTAECNGINSSASVASASDTTEISYSQNIQASLGSGSGEGVVARIGCDGGGCHSSTADTRNRLALIDSTWACLKTDINTCSGSMSGVSLLTAAEISLIQQWVSEGANNN